MARSFILGLALIATLFSSTTARADSPTPPCTAPEYHQLDFWIGNWDVFEAGNDKPVAHVLVNRILNGCALHEQYEQNGMQGESFSSYDAGRKQWRQSWYTNRGKSLELIGKKEGDAIILAGTDYDSTPQSLVRGTWKSLNGSVQETAVVSNDGGKTWKPWFDLSFRPSQQSSSNSADDDRKSVLQLDAEYQSAVMKNDAATMARLLPDDFILVSSSGKNYSKADLLAEARSGTITYEVQSDSDQTVRVRGSTAVITAQLHARGTEAGKPFDYSIWFSDTYTRTPNGWRYVLGQAGARLPISTP